MIRAEKYIETYIFHPEELTPGQRSEIEKIIRENEEMRILADWYRDLKQEIYIVEQTKQKVRPRSSAIELTASVREKKQQYVFKLAAKSPSQHKKRRALKTLRTFVSTQESAIVRVLKSEDDSGIQIHAISERIAPDDLVLLTVPVFKELLISKPGGIFEPSGVSLSANDIREWDSCTLFVPMDRLDLLFEEHSGRVYLDSHQTNKDELTVVLEDKPGYFVLHLETSAGYNIHKVVAGSGGKEYMLGLEGARVNIPKSIIKGRLTSIFFFN